MLSATWLPEEATEIRGCKHFTSPHHPHSLITIRVGAGGCLFSRDGKNKALDNVEKRQIFLSLLVNGVTVQSVRVQCVGIFMLSTPLQLQRHIIAFHKSPPLLFVQTSSWLQINHSGLWPWGRWRKLVLKHKNNESWCPYNLVTKQLSVEYFTVVT